MPDTTFETGSDWASDEQGETISEEEAGKILAERLGWNYNRRYEDARLGSGVWPEATGARMIEQLVKTIPPELRTREILSTMDPRTLLSKVMSTETAAKARGDFTFNGATFTPEMQMIAGSAFVDYRSKAAKEYEQALIDIGTPPEQIPDLVDQEMNAWKEDRGKFIRQSTPTGSLMTDPETGQIMSTGGNRDTNDIASLIADTMSGEGGTVARPIFMSNEDVRLAFRDESPIGAIGAYMNDQRARAAYKQGILGDFGAGAPGRDVTNINMGDFAPPVQSYTDTSSLAGIEQASKQGALGGYTLSEALSLPSNGTMSHEDIVRLSKKMEKAGLFAQVGGKPFVMGDPADPQFREAYRLMLSKAVASGEGINTILQRDTLAYEDSLDENIRAKLTDPARIRASSDSLGRQILGRKLTEKEQGILVKTIHDLQKGQAVAEGTPDATGDVVDVDYEARMEEYIRNANPAEAGAHDTALEYDMFKKMVTGG